MPFFAFSCPCAPIQYPCGSTGSVGIRSGNPISQRQVRFFHGSPNIYGSMIWLYGGKSAIFSGTGFSMAIIPHCAFVNCMKKRAASSIFAIRSCDLMLWSLSNNRTADAAVRYVQGGCAISKSHSPSIWCVPPRHIHKLAISVNQWKAVAENVPFRMASGARLNIAGERIVSKPTHLNAYTLGFLTGDQYVHWIHSFIRISIRGVSAYSLRVLPSTTHLSSS